MQGSMEASTSTSNNTQTARTTKVRRKRQKNADSSNASENPAKLEGGSSEQPSYVAQPAQIARYARGSAINPATRNKKLATHLTSLANQQKRAAAAAYEHDSLLLPQDVNARLQAETDLERTWKVSQDEIIDNIGAAAASKNFNLRLEDFGPYKLNYTADGRHLAIAGRKGHVATFDWQAGKLGTELHLKETVRDVCWLHNTSFFAAAQKKYVYIYDSNGLEIHQLRNHLEVNSMQFLRYHFLLATVGNAGYLKYQDTSTGALVAEHRTKLGACSTMAQNHHSGVISLGHSNGTVTMWTPNISTAQVTLLAHGSPVSAIAYDPSTTGNYFTTSGLDGSMKVWDVRKWAALHEWQLHKPATSLAYSQKGLLAAGWSNHATVYAETAKAAARAPGPYMTKLFPSTAVQSLAFCPFEDVLGVGHASGISSLLIPGAGEANYDSLEADPFESKKSRREREVIGLLDKIQPDQIHLDTDFIGKLVEKKTAADPLEGMGVNDRRLAALPGRKQKSYSEMSRLERVQQDEDPADAGENDETEAPPGQDEEGKVRKPRGRNKVLKRILRRKKNIIDAKTMRVRDLMEERKKAAQIERKRSKISHAADDGALGRFA